MQKGWTDLETHTAVWLTTLRQDGFFKKKELSKFSNVLRASFDCLTNLTFAWCTLVECATFFVACIETSGMPPKRVSIRRRRFQ
jgi:hypothetical protein